ncbi:hypothetical protein JZX87_30485 [Agrobacterium sp. Ap1]|uniref:hypothetical protein n=1 Tax=Agrobacterium sp. Ap1 TaxID=2815337 RepID=UPI001A8E2E6D|nr:hypothetical protein [Agrobacterium sp. Ap1]MBO0145448.1 hypothetical protein [Agrobacterium sp. Ap1]
MISRRSLIAGMAFLHTAARPASLIALETIATVSPAFAKGGGGNGGGNGGQGFGRRNSAGDNNSKGRFNNSAGVTEATGGYSVSVKGGTVEIRYANGILERLTNRRFSMTDRRGRTIVDRPATSDDRARIQSLLK